MMNYCLSFSFGMNSVGVQGGKRLMKRLRFVSFRFTDDMEDQMYFVYFNKKSMLNSLDFTKIQKGVEF